MSKMYVPMNDVSLIFCPKKCLRPGVSRFGGVQDASKRGMFCAPVWREMLGPLHLRTKPCLP